MDSEPGERPRGPRGGVPPSRTRRGRARARVPLRPSRRVDQRPGQLVPRGQRGPRSSMRRGDAESALEQGLAAVATGATQGTGKQAVRQGFVWAVEAALALGEVGQADELLTMVEGAPGGHPAAVPRGPGATLPRADVGRGGGIQGEPQAAFGNTTSPSGSRSPSSSSGSGSRLRARAPRGQATFGRSARDLRAARSDAMARPTRGRGSGATRPGTDLSLANQREGDALADWSVLRSGEIICRSPRGRQSRPETGEQRGDNATRAPSRECRWLLVRTRAHA